MILTRPIRKHPRWSGYIGSSTTYRPIPRACPRTQARRGYRKALYLGPMISKRRSMAARVRRSADTVTSISSTRQPDSGEAKNTTALAMSSGSPMRPIIARAAKRSSERIAGQRGADRRDRGHIDDPAIAPHPHAPHHCARRVDHAVHVNPVHARDLLLLVG